jgi:hypothetical protein
MGGPCWRVGLCPALVASALLILPFGTLYFLDAKHVAKLPFGGVIDGAPGIVPCEGLDPLPACNRCWAAVASVRSQAGRPSVAQKRTILAATLSCLVLVCRCTSDPWVPGPALVCPGAVVAVHASFFQT